MSSRVPTNLEELRELATPFLAAAAQAGLTVPADTIVEEYLPAPHSQPKSLPLGKHAIYWFSIGDRCLKVGKAGAKSNARYTSQHYNPGSSGSNLAKSILKHRDRIKAVLPAAKHAEVDHLDETTVGGWIKANTSRSNLLVGLSLNDVALGFLETFVQARLQPMFEGRIAAV